MKKSPIPPSGVPDPGLTIAQLEREAADAEEWAEAYAMMARSLRASASIFRSKQEGRSLPRDRGSRPLTGPGRYAGRQQLIEYVELALRNHFRRAATFEELAAELEDDGVYLGQGRKSLVNCIATWAQSRHEQRRKAPRLRLLKQYSRQCDINSALKAGEKVGLAEWGKDKF